MLIFRRFRSGRPMVTNSECESMRILIALITVSFLICGCTPAPSPTGTPDAHAGHDHGSHDGHDHGSHDGHAHTPAPTGTPGAQATLAPIAEVPEGAKVSFGEPADGATVSSPVKVVMQVEGMTVKPAGTQEANTGHHHLIIDGEGIPTGEVVPASKTVIHYGKGQTETELKLEPGKHTITMQFADFAHRSYGAKMSTTVSVTVK